MSKFKKLNLNKIITIRNMLINNKERDKKEKSKIRKLWKFNLKNLKDIQTKNRNPMENYINRKKYMTNMYNLTYHLVTFKRKKKERKN